LPPAALSGFQGGWKAVLDGLFDGGHPWEIMGVRLAPLIGEKIGKLDRARHSPSPWGALCRHRLAKAVGAMGHPMAASILSTKAPLRSFLIN